MVSSNEAGFDLRETFPLSREYLAYLELREPDGAGTANESSGCHFPMDYRGWLLCFANPKVEVSNLNYLTSIRDSAKSGLGYCDNRHLNYFVESIFVNVGGHYLEISSQSKKSSGVGGFIVVGGWESQPHGEGNQSINTFLLER